MQLIEAKFNLAFDPDVAKPPVTVTAALAPQVLLKDLESKIREVADIPPECKAIRFKDLTPLRLMVTTEKSCYDPAQGTLAINQDEPLVDYYKKYRARHHPVNREDRTSRSTMTREHSDSWITVGPASIRFNRTLRVPDTSGKFHLPPGLGPFPLADATRYAKTAPSEISRRGGFLMPMYQREAMWISFSGSTYCAVKISIGQVNAITGESRTAADVPATKQDYLALPQQPWLDGICTSPGVVRQFVAMPLGEGYTVEEQVTGSATHGGIQIDVFPSLAPAVKCEVPEKANVQLEAHRTPKDLGIASGAEIIMKTPDLPPRLTVRDYVDRISSKFVLDVMCHIKPPGLVYVQVESKDTIEIDWPAGTTVSHLRELLKEQGVKPDGQRLMFQGRQLANFQQKEAYDIKKGDTIQLLPEPEEVAWRSRSVRMSSAPAPPPAAMMSKKAKPGGAMGIAAGGQISQKIYEDNLPTNIYDEEKAERVWIHTVSTDLWEEITGVVAPVTPINALTYKDYNYPWFELYDEHKKSVAPTGLLAKIRSVHQIDKERADAAALDARNPPQCALHPAAVAESVLRPCGHVACYACVGRAVVEGNVCGVCTQRVDRFVGFKTPVKGGAGDPAQMWALEEQIQGPEVGKEGNAVVITLMLEDDRVSWLRGPCRR